MLLALKVLPLNLWGNTLIDGHKRYEICKRHNIEFGVVGRIFKNKDARLNLNSVVVIFKNNIIEKYLSEILGIK